MKGKTSNCSELNKPNSKFCVKCRMVLTYDVYSEVIEEKQRKESEVKQKKIREEMKKQLAQLVTQLKPELIKEGFSTEKNSGV